MAVYTVTTPVYEGPLDLLLHLIERAELDITRLALAQVTDQYLEYLRTLSEADAEDVSAFLVIAARLVQIKSEVLLPRPTVRAEGVEDAGELLARQLRVYKRYKEIAMLFFEREESGMRTYLRLAPPPKVEGELDLSGVGISDLHSAAFLALTRIDNRMGLNQVVPAPKITIREKIQHISTHLHTYRRSSFRSLFQGAPSTLDVVITFLALLELVKRHFILVNQEGIFEEIFFETDSSWDESEPLELEFGE